MGEVPTLEGRVVRLRAIETRDYEILRRIELSGSVIQTYRQRGATPGPDAYARSLWADVLVNLAVCIPPYGNVVGNVACYSADFRNQHAWISIVIAPWAKGPDTFESVELLCDYVFRTFNFRKLYFDVLEPNLVQFAAIEGYVATEEARHVEDAWIDGSFVDRVVMAMWRDRFYAVYSGSRKGVSLARAVRSALGDGEDQ
jgi:RimJ/RimL family protein N-acetyltransferase